LVSMLRMGSGEFINSSRGHNDLKLPIATSMFSQGSDLRPCDAPGDAVSGVAHDGTLTRKPCCRSS